MKILTRALDRLWPISNLARVIALQFSAPRGARMTLLRQSGCLEFRFGASSPGLGATLLGTDLRSLRVVAFDGTVTVHDPMRGSEVKLNWRETRLIGEAIRRWLEMDLPESQVGAI